MRSCADLESNVISIPTFARLGAKRSANRRPPARARFGSALCLRLLLLLLPNTLCAETLADAFLQAYFEQYPTQATAAGVYRHDGALDRLEPGEIEDWLKTVERFDRDAAEQQSECAFDDCVDLDVLRRQLALERFELVAQRRPQADPLFWAEALGRATLYQLLRDDRPERERLDLAAQRVAKLPALAKLAMRSLTDVERIAPQAAAEAARRLRALAGFYRDGYRQADKRAAARRSGERAAVALETLATFCEQLSEKARGDFRLRDDYATRFRLGTALDTDVAEVLRMAHQDLAEKREEAAAYARGIWPALFDEPAPLDDRDVLRRAFAHIEAQRPATTAELIEQYRADAALAFEFARKHEVMTIPEPLSLYIDKAPAWLGGQSVGGVFAPGPFAAEADTLFLLPNIEDDAPEQAKARFFSAFNTGFNRMIVPHELVPGHYAQLKVAARQPRPIRSVFGDGVYTEGWGSFAERLMLDLGWGGPPERLAHYKKQLENITRVIADISVHTLAWDENQLTQFATREGLMDAQFASNLWRRAMFSSPQLTTYHLGYRDIQVLWQSWLSRRNANAPVREFVDAMLSEGAVPLAVYRRKLQ